MALMHAGCSQNTWNATASGERVTMRLRLRSNNSCLLSPLHLVVSRQVNEPFHQPIYNIIYVCWLVHNVHLFHQHGWTIMTIGSNWTNPHVALGQVKQKSWFGILNVLKLMLKDWAVLREASVGIMEVSGGVATRLDKTSPPAMFCEVKF